MTSKNAKEFAVQMAILGEAFSKEPSKQKVEIYFRALQDLTIDEIKRAVATVINTRTITGTFPLIAEIREAVHGRAEDRATAAISLIEQAWRQGLGRYDSIDLGDPVLHQVIENWGGWPELCNVKIDDWRFIRRDLERHYVQIMGSGNGNAPKFLPGENYNDRYLDWLKSRGRQIDIKRLLPDNEVRWICHQEGTLAD